MEWSSKSNTFILFLFVFGFFAQLSVELAKLYSNLSTDFISTILFLVYNFFKFVSECYFPPSELPCFSFFIAKSLFSFWVFKLLF